MKYFVLLFLLCIACTTPKQDKKAVAEVEENIEELPDSVDVKFTQRQLNRVKKYEQSIKKHSRRYNVDWRLIVAIIMRESSFKANAVSRVGAKGLMQIMPRNEEYLESELDIDYIYEQPDENIKAGIYHFTQQQTYFAEIKDKEKRLYVSLAAYNAGYGRLRDALSISRYLFPEDVYLWENVKTALYKLHPKYYELHLDVWEEGKPRYGYFKNPKETINYVEIIMSYYEQFKTVFKAI